MVITLAFSGTVKSATVQQHLRVEIRVPRPVKDDDFCCNSSGHVSFFFLYAPLEFCGVTVDICVPLLCKAVGWVAAAMSCLLNCSNRELRSATDLVNFSSITFIFAAIDLIH